MDGEPTVEQLQAELLRLKTENEQLTTEKSAIQQKLDRTDSDLKQARQLNTQYYHQMSFGTETKTPQEEPEEHKETVDEFIGSFVEGAVNVLKKNYGDKIAYKQ